METTGNAQMERFEKGQYLEQTIKQSSEYKDYVRFAAHTSCSDLDLKTIVFLFTFCIPGATQADFAAKCGTSAVTLSRALTNNERIRPEWTEAVQEILTNLSIYNFDHAYQRITEVQKTYKVASQRFIFYKVVLDYLVRMNKISPTVEFDEFGENRSFSLTEVQTQRRWILLDYDAVERLNENVSYSMLFSELEGLQGRSSTGWVTLFTTSSATFNHLVEQHLSTIGKSAAKNSSCYRSIMLIDDCCLEVEQEFILSHVSM